MTATTKRHLTTAALVLVLVALVALPLLMDAGDFGGSDDKATETIQQSDPGYRPWFHSLFEPTGEVESGLFAIQAGLGCGIVGYVVGCYRGRRTAARPPVDAPGSATAAQQP